MTKTNPGNFFEDFELGQVIEHATPRTVTDGDRGVYGAIYPTRFALPSSGSSPRSPASTGRRWRNSSVFTLRSARPCPTSR